METCKHYGGKDKDSGLHDGFCRLTGWMVTVSKTCAKCTRHDDRKAPRMPENERAAR